MTDDSSDGRSAAFENADLTGARFLKVHLNDAVFRMVDLSGVRMRDVSLSGVAIDGAQTDGLSINGVEIGPMIEAELTRRVPARALRRSTDPADLRAAWASLERSWTATSERAAALPAGTADVSVDGEWSFAETLRHLVFATDAWLGAILGESRPFHPWGVPFSEYVDRAAELGIELDAAPAFVDVLSIRADRVARVREFLSDVTPERLAEEREGPVWEHGRQLSALRCLWVILNEECEHLRFATRDLDVIEADSASARHPRSDTSD